MSWFRDASLSSDFDRSEGHPALEVRGVTRTFGGVTAVDHVSFTVQSGERVGVIGPNGAGKSTLFKVVAGDVQPSGGQVFFRGREITRDRVYRRARAGLGRTYQVTTLMTTLTVEENLRLAAGGSPRQSSNMHSINDVVEKFSLFQSLNRPAGQLAYGEQRRLELALALCGGATTLLLDEPAAGLGPDDREVMRNVIRELSASLTVLVIEHDMELALELVSRVLCLHNGALVADEPVERIRDNEFVREIYLGSHATGDGASYA